MKTTFKFLTVVFVAALSLGFYTALNAQSQLHKVDKYQYPGPSVEVFIKVKQRSVEVFDLTAILRMKGAEKGLQPPYGFVWFKDGQMIGLSATLKGVSFGTYTVYVRFVNSSMWGMAEITLSPQSVLMGKVDYM